MEANQISKKKNTRAGVEKAQTPPTAEERIAALEAALLQQMGV